MLKVGLTGGIASGKSTVCQLFSGHGITIVDADIIARQLVEPNQPCLTNIVQTFGEQIRLANGELDRPQLRQLIFSNPKAKKQLENILHPKIREQLIQQSNAANSPYCILSIPLLIEADMTDLADRTLVVETSPEQQLKRVCQRDNISTEQAKAIISSQSSPAQRKAIADDIIHNTKSAETLSTLVENLHKKYIDIAKAIL